MNTVDAIKSKKDINKMRAALSGRDRLLFVIGINCGLRISDILPLRISDVLHPNGKPKDGIVIVEQKTGKERKFPFNASILKELAELEYHADAYLFPSRKGGTPIGRVQAYRILNAAAERAGIKVNIGSHSMRKTFGYFAYKAGHDISLLQSIFNHSSQAVTLKYLGITQENIDDVYININL